MGIKVVYNACYGGFSLSRKAALRLFEQGVTEFGESLEAQKKMPSYYGDHYSTCGLSRHDPRLVQVVEELGEEANGAFADLQVDEIEGNRYRIDEYDGYENVQVPDDIEWVVVE